MRVYITEVAPRDGLQNVKENVPTDKKVAFVNALSETGVDEIEVTAFVHPKWVPQMADAEEVLRRIKRKEGVKYSAIVPNERGLERALSVGVDKVAVLTAATDTFNLKNINTDPYEGKVPPQRVRDVVLRLLDVGVDEVSLGDTIGRASPKDVAEVLDLLLKDVPKDKIVLHFHATYGMGVANVLCAYREHGIYRYDSSAGGLGGCPYAPGASGNVATEDVVFALKSVGADVRVDDVEEGTAFVVIRGNTFDNLQDVPEAIKRGARLIITPEKLPHDVPQMVVGDTRKAALELADRVRRHNRYERKDDHVLPDKGGVEGTGISASADRDGRMGRPPRRKGGQTDHTGGLLHSPYTGEGRPKGCKVRCHGGLLHRPRAGTGGRAEV